MCKYCDFFVKQIDNPSYKDILSMKTKLVDGIVKQETCIYIGNAYGKDYSVNPALKLNQSYADGSNTYVKDTEKAIPITYCPFCGVNLKEAREKYEKEYDDD